MRRVFLGFRVCCQGEDCIFPWQEMMWPFIKSEQGVPDEVITLPRTTNPMYLLEASTRLPRGRYCKLVST
jgi:hypothetical protein